MQKSDDPPYATIMIIPTMSCNNIKQSDSIIEIC